MDCITKDFLSIFDVLNKQEYSSKFMENLINDLLDFAKLENNKFKLYDEYYNLQSTITESFEMMLFWAKQKNIQLTADIDRKEYLELI